MGDRVAVGVAERVLEVEPVPGGLHVPVAEAECVVVAVCDMRTVAEGAEAEGDIEGVWVGERLNVSVQECEPVEVPERLQV